MTNVTIVTNGNWTPKQCEHGGKRSKCLDRGCFETCPWGAHIKCQLYILWLKAWAFWPRAIVVSCWWWLLSLCVASVFLSRFIPNYIMAIMAIMAIMDNKEHCIDWAPKIGSIEQGGQAAKHCLGRPSTDLPCQGSGRGGNSSAAWLPSLPMRLWPQKKNKEGALQCRFVFKGQFTGTPGLIIWYHLIIRGKPWTCALHPSWEDREKRWWNRARCAQKANPPGAKETAWSHQQGYQWQLKAEHSVHGFSELPKNHIAPLDACTVVGMTNPPSLLQKPLRKTS